MFAPPDDVARVARAVLEGTSQREAADALGHPQPRISEAVNGRRLSVALEIIDHYGPSDETTGGPFYFIPSDAAAIFERDADA